MPFEIPHELIAEIQAVIRKEANLPSVEDAVSRVDPSPDYLRCKHCKGRLLYGVNSIVCVFCGTHPDTRPDSVRFTSTLAYRWFLSSLRLDGSEVVEVPNGQEEAKVGRRGQEAPANEAERTPRDWRFGGSKLGGVDLSLLESTKREEEVAKKGEEEVKDEWEADFQFAGASAKGFASFNAFPSPSSGNDLADQLDSVFGSERKPKAGGIVASTSVSYAKDNWF